MAYDVPTAAELKAAFAPFADVDDATIDFWIGRAGRMVDTTWAEDDFTFAQMLLAAHYMVEQGLGTGAEAAVAAQGASGFKAMRSGALTLERFDKRSGEAAGAYSGTSYGQQFAALLRRNRGGPLVQPTGVAPPVDYPPYPGGGF